MVGLGRAPDLGAGVLDSLRRLPDATPRRRRTYPTRHLRRRLVHLLFHRCADRDLFHQVAEEAKITLKVSQNLHASMTPYILGAVLGKSREDALQAGFDLEN